MTIEVGINSYVSIADADAFFAGRLRNSAWINTADADKEAAVLQATREIDRLSFVGYVSSQTQALAWPRSSVRDSEGRIIDPNAPPSAIINATCEWALILLTAEPNDSPAIKRKRVGVLEIEYRPAAQDALPAVVRRELQQFLRSSKNSTALVF